ncbi:class I SAM-dependent methyltransferase [Alkalicaulis satelles]|uniref:Class I SAM-dependent methyltransferase n=1 Tax=Alkalicaulis satelles TaxID=2609175 RepID=A0A5M6ZAA6_9PROT|nr:class I SAM-dependent methyltransferase [Alkalicaulis satelles]KAA5801636.1 class I SAM-dependent methyltransferase [Alkalicaulis satelles]
MTCTIDQSDEASIVTLNRRGRTSTILNEINAYFVDLASQASRPVLDIGCAMGVAALAALRSGAFVHANDIDPGHLRILQDAAPIELRDSLKLVCGRFPNELAYEENQFDAIHASNLLNFLTGHDIEAGMHCVARWLAPGGRFVSISGSPFAANIRGFIPHYKNSKAKGLRWPGECYNIHQYSNHPTLYELPDFLHLLDPSVLGRAARAAGLVVEKAAYIHRRHTPSYIRLDGRENVVLVARKPHTSGGKDLHL